MNISPANLLPMHALDIEKYFFEYNSD